MTAPPVFGRLQALADPIRGRLLLVLERQELNVREIQAALRLPQSTVSRHLKLLVDLGLVQTRSEGTSNWYRMPDRDLAAPARRLWQAVRDDVAGTSAARRDAERLERVLADRHLTSQRFFATTAGQWDKLRSDLFGERFGLQALLGLLDRKWVVGDLGCGTGQLTAALAPFVERVIGLDESAAMLEAAGRRTHELGNVELRHGELEQPPLEPEELDAAVLVLVLHHAARPEQVLRAACRALKPGGRLLVVDMLPHEQAEFREQMGHQWLGFDEAQLSAWLAEAGFAAPRFVALPVDATAKGPGLFVMTASKTVTGNR